MKSRFRKLRIESLEGRSVLSTTWVADFNRDGHQDVATLTDANTITVSLFDPSDGSYSVSDILSSPKNQPIQDINNVVDRDADGDLDIIASGSNRSGSTYF